MSDMKVEWSFGNAGGAVKSMNCTDPCAAAKRMLAGMGNHSTLQKGEGDLRVEWSLKGGKGGNFDALNCTDVKAALKRLGVQLLKTYCNEVGEVGGSVLSPSDLRELYGKEGRLGGGKDPNKTCDRLQKGEGVAVDDIIAYLHWYFDVNMKWAEANDDVRCGSVATDELEKFLSRGEVGKVDTPIISVAGYPIAEKVVDIMKRKGLFSVIEKGLTGE